MTERVDTGRANRFLELFAIPLGFTLAWFLYEVSSGLLLLFLAVSIAIGLNGPVMRLQRRGLSRHTAALVVLMLFFAAIIGVWWMVLPLVAEQLAALIAGFPDLVTQASQRLSESLRDYPDLQRAVELNGSTLGSLAPDAVKLLVGVGGASFQLFGIIAALIVFFASIIYLTINPGPLLVRYFSFFSDRLRPKAMRSFLCFSAMVGGWMRANVIVGSIQAVLVGTFLSIVNIPGALVWAALAFFSEFVPRLGAYIMAAPPVLIALSVSPGMALTVAIFYLVMNEALGNLLTPQVSGAQMNIHPFILILFVVVLALAFGLMGALVATPFAALVVSHLDGFGSRRRQLAAARLVRHENRIRGVRRT